MTTGENAPLRVLIAGGGIAGLATAVALLRISGVPNLDIQIYEQADEFLQIGASIALSPNGLRTLEKLGISEALDDEFGFRGPSGIPQIYRHWKTNQVISVDTHSMVTDPRHVTTRFHRAHIHEILLKHVPAERVHLGKKTVRATADNSGVVLFFEDGTKAIGDLLIGADGIRSMVRKSFVPDHELKFTGKVFFRATFDASLVEGKIPELPLDAVHWWGPNNSFFASKLGKNQYTTVGTFDDTRSAEELEKSVTWNQEGNVEFFKNIFKVRYEEEILQGLPSLSWNPVVKALTELTPATRLFPNYYGESLDSWILHHRVTLIGDAAHTHGGAFAAGGSLALDDSLALALSLKHILTPIAGQPVSTSATTIRAALSLYDSVRRPHLLRLLEVVHSSVRGKNPPEDSKVSPEAEDKALITRLRSRVDTSWLSEHDVEKAFTDVIYASSIKEKL